MDDRNDRNDMDDNDTPDNFEIIGEVPSGSNYKIQKKKSRNMAFHSNIMLYATIFVKAGRFLINKKKICDNFCFLFLFKINKHTYRHICGFKLNNIYIYLHIYNNNIGRNNNNLQFK